MEPIRKTIRALVTKSSDEVMECSGGQEAVDHYEEFHPDCILMDIRMKGMNGFLTIKLIRAIDPQSRIVIVTNHDNSSYRKMANQLKADGFFSKANLLELQEFIRQT